jgi:hypothetical protein
VVALRWHWQYTWTGQAVSSSVVYGYRDVFPGCTADAFSRFGGDAFSLLFLISCVRVFCFTFAAGGWHKHLKGGLPVLGAGGAVWGLKTHSISLSGVAGV